MLADRLRRSKSWVDKVERGVRALDRYSVIQELAHVLRVDPEVLLGQQPQRRRSARSTGWTTSGPLSPATTLPQAPPQTTEEVRRQVGYAWLTYQHAHYGQLVRVLPSLLDVVQGVRSAELRVQTYRITSVVAGEARRGRPRLAGRRSGDGSRRRRSGARGDGGHRR